MPHVDVPPASGSTPGTQRKLNKGEVLLRDIAALKEERKKLNEEKHAKAKALKQKERQRARLKNKAKQLSNEDLLSLVFIRDQEHNAKKQKAADNVDEPTAAAPTSE